MTTTWKNFLAREWAALMVALAVGAIIVLPHLLIPLRLPPGVKYEPLVWRHVNDISYDETFYAIPVREILSGSWLPGDSQVWEWRSAPAAFGLLPYWFMASLAKLTGTLSGAFVAADFILPTVAVILFYLYCAHSITRPLALAVAVLTVVASQSLYLGVNWLSNPDPHMARWFASLETAIANTDDYPLGYYSRFPSMQFVGPLFFAGLLALQHRSDKKGFGAALVAGVVLSASFYSYFYLYTLWPPILAALVLLIALNRDRQGVVWVGVVGIVTIVAATPFLWMLFSFQSSPAASSFQRKLGWSWSPNLRLSLLVLAAIGLAAFNWFRKRTRTSEINLAVLIGVLVMGLQQWITGKSLFPYHYFTLAGLPVGLLVLATASGGLAAKQTRERWARAVAFLIVVVTLSWGTWHSVVFAARQGRYFTIEPSTRQALTWLDQTTPKDSVVGSLSLEVQTLASVHTKNPVYLPNACPMCTVVPDEEIIERLAVMGRILRVPETWLVDRLQSTTWRPHNWRSGESPQAFEREVWGFTLFFYRFYSVGPDKQFVSEVMDRFRWWQGRPLKEALGRYRLDYLWVSEADFRIVHVPAEFVLAARFGDVGIYRRIK